jgi:N utilization substance protein B
MKTASDPRHKKRQTIIEDLFKIDFHKQRVGQMAKAIIGQKEIIDKKIEEAASEFPIDKINKIDLAILRLAVYELLIEKKEPPKVIIDEAIELSKEYAAETSPAFINGALGKILDEATTKTK